MTNQHSSARILVAASPNEDHRLLLTALRNAGYGVSIARDAEQAYNRVLAWKPQLVVMDARLDKGDGVSTTRLLKQTSDTRDITVLLVSAATTLEAKLEGLRAGAVDYIEKPAIRVGKRLAGRLAGRSDRLPSSAPANEIGIAATTR